MNILNRECDNRQDNTADAGANCTGEAGLQTLNYYEFEARNEQISAKLSTLSDKAMRYFESVNLTSMYGYSIDICEEDFNNLYVEAQKFAAILDQTLTAFRSLLREKYEEFSCNLTDKASIWAKEYDGMIGIVLPIPYKILGNNYAKKQYPHTSTPRVLLRDCLDFAGSSSLYHSPLSINFLFNYDEKTFPCDHDKLQVSGWIDEITRALDVDDNGLLCRLHYASSTDKRLAPNRTFICVTHRDAQPLTPEQIAEFFVKHFQYNCLCNSK